MMTILSPGYMPMNKILEQVYIGNYYSAQMLDIGNPEGITDVLNCTSNPHEGLKKFHVSQLNLQDGYEISFETIQFAVRTIEGAVHRGGKILVHCQAGISRSCGIVCAYLMYCGFSWNEAKCLISAKRPQAWPHPLIEKSVKQAFGQLITPATTMLGDK